MREHESTKARLKSLLAGMKGERSSFDPVWRELGDYIYPTRTRFLTSQNNKGWRRNQNIIDSTPTLAAGTLQAGLHSNITSPSRKWFGFGPPTPDLNENAAVKAYLHECRDIILDVLLRSNVYQQLSVLYGDIGVFGTGAMAVMEDEQDVVRAYDFPVGSFYLGLDDTRRVTVFAHEYQMTVRQIVHKFAKRRRDGTRDLSKLSDSTQEAWKRGGASLEQAVEVVQVIQPNADFNPERIESKYKAWYSCHYEPAGREDRLLEESGYDEFPIIAARWSATGNDVYGTNCPGMQCLGDAKQLQTMAKQAGTAYEKSINPPLVASMAMRQAAIGLRPGYINYVTQTADAQLKPLHEVRPDFTAHIAMVNDVRALVRSAFKEDLFLMLAQLDRANITATEIMERREEKMQTLGPVLERLNDDVLEPLINRVWAMLNRLGRLPQAPEELQGRDLRVEYESSMSQAQKQSGLGVLERFISTVSTIAAVRPDIMDKVDTDQWVDEYAQALSVPPRVTVPDDEVALMRQARAKAAKAQQMAESAPKMATAAKTLSETDPAGGMLPNALTALGTWGGADQSLTKVAA